MIMEKELTIGGMSCMHCVHAVRGALSNLEGVEVKEVRIGHATVSVDPERVDDAKLRRALDDEGYPVEAIA